MDVYHPEYVILVEHFVIYSHQWNGCLLKCQRKLRGHVCALR